MDTKRRIEYGVHQILLEVGDLVKLHAKELNATVNRRFDNLSSTIVDNQTGTMTNLTSKIETEISQVWRQIGIMYQQLTASAGALDRLQQQTENYVNGSLETMGSMGGKVGQITSLMAEMDSNLNYLLGRLSLVTQEFNSIKSDLGSALDNIRHAFISVQKKVKEFGKTGIIPIPDSHEAPSSVLPEGDEGNQVSPLNVKAQ
jgi:septation ring formation regulator EzrA